VERLPVRYAAIVCIVVSGMFTGGAGAVAFATPGTDGSDGSTSADGTQNTDTGVPKVSGLPGSGTSNKNTVGPTAPPAMNLSPWLGPGPSSTNVANVGLPGPATPGLTMPKSGLTVPPWAPLTAPLWAFLTVPASAPLTVPAPNPAGRGPASQTSEDTRLPGNLPTADPPKQSPTVSLLPSVPPGVPVGQPVTIDAPLPGQLPFDLYSPIVPQLLPPPVVVILMAAAQQIPLAGLLITPVLNAKVPPFIADVVIPALLSDMAVPTSTLGASSPATTAPEVASLTSPASFSKPAGRSLPPELGVMGMDVPQAPELTPAPPTVEPPHWTSPSNNDITALSAPVAFRAGYSDYLRNAGMAQITAMAVPGAAAILLFTLGGGFIGYRQARAGHVIRAEGMARFMR
jgi:hypothetical protein